MGTRSDSLAREARSKKSGRGRARSTSRENIGRNNARVTSESKISKRNKREDERKEMIYGGTTGRDRAGEGGGKGSEGVRGKCQKRGF